MALLEKPDVEHVASQDVLLRAATEQVNDRGYIVAKLEEIVRWARSGLDSSTTPASETRGYGPSESKRVRNGLAAGANGIRTIGPPSAASLKEAHLSSSSGGVGPRSVTLPEFAD